MGFVLVVCFVGVQEGLWGSVDSGTLFKLLFPFGIK